MHNLLNSGDFGEFYVIPDQKLISCEFGLLKNPVQVEFYIARDKFMCYQKLVSNNPRLIKESVYIDGKQILVNNTCIFKTIDIYFSSKDVDKNFSIRYPILGAYKINEG